MRGDKECPFSGVTKSGRVWRKMPESDARSVGWQGLREDGRLQPRGYTQCHSSARLETGGTRESGWPWWWRNGLLHE